MWGSRRSGAHDGKRMPMRDRWFRATAIRIGGLEERKGVGFAPDSPSFLDWRIPPKTYIYICRRKTNFLESQKQLQKQLQKELKKDFQN